MNWRKQFEKELKDNAIKYKRKTYPILLLDTTKLSYKYIKWLEQKLDKREKGCKICHANYGAPHMFKFNEWILCEVCYGKIYDAQCEAYQQAKKEVEESF